MTTTAAQGQLRVDGDRRAVRFERRYEATPAEVWSALTEPERLARWLADAELDLRVGGQYVLRFAAEEVVPRLRQTDCEITQILRALDGGFIEAGPSGSPLRRS